MRKSKAQILYSRLRKKYPNTKRYDIKAFQRYVPTYSIGYGYRAKVINSSDKFYRRGISFPYFWGVVDKSKKI